MPLCTKGSILRTNGVNENDADPVYFQESKTGAWLFRILLQTVVIGLVQWQ